MRKLNHLRDMEACTGGGEGTLRGLSRRPLQPAAAEGELNLLRNVRVGTAVLIIHVEVIIHIEVERSWNNNCDKYDV